METIIGSSAQDTVIKSSDQDKIEYFEAMRKYRVIMSFADSLLEDGALSTKEYAAFIAETAEKLGFSPADNR